MRAAVGLVWRYPARVWDRLALRLGDLGFQYRVARVRRLRRTGRNPEAERTLRAMRAYVIARGRRWPTGA